MFHRLVLEKEDLIHHKNRPTLVVRFPMYSPEGRTVSGTALFDTPLLMSLYRLWIDLDLRGTQATLSLDGWIDSKRTSRLEILKKVPKTQECKLEVRAGRKKGRFACWLAVNHEGTEYYGNCIDQEESEMLLNLFGRAYYQEMDFVDGMEQYPGTEGVMGGSLIPFGLSHSFQ